jgi:biopolymer transport protein TolR
MGMTTTGGHNGQPHPTVNVTPLVDIALVVLIIFMVVTPMMTKTFWLNLPKKPDEAQAATPPPDEKNEPLVMTVAANGAIQINRHPIDRGELATRLPRMLAAQKQQVLYFDADDDVPYGVAVETMDLARSAGARSIAILTEKLAD